MFFRSHFLLSTLHLSSRTCPLTLNEAALNKDPQEGNMGNLSFELKVTIICAVVLVCSAAHQEYFPNASKLTWDKARSYCQMCYTDLVTLDSGNIHLVQARAQNLTSACWVGLRKNFTSSNSNMIWSSWANGDPLLFQNWYPGWPVFRAVNTDCCSDSAAATSTAETTDTEGPTMITTTEPPSTTEGPTFNITTAAPEEVCLQPSADGDAEYLEDSCVAMLSFGAWVEKNCLECRPFICYEDVLSDPAKVSNNTENYTISWQRPPGDISHYFIEVQGDNETKREYQTSNLQYDLVDLTPGTLYSVQVFPVKCERNLSAQEVHFYTTPKKVKNLQVTKVTETSVSLGWNAPDGRVDFYIIRDQNGTEINTTTKSTEVGGLTPGNFHTFTVFSGVVSILSEKSIKTTYTMPGKVSDLRVHNNTVDSLRLSWESPYGNVSEFLAEALKDNNDVLAKNVTVWPQAEAHLTGLPPGSRIKVTVTAQVNGSVKGETVSVIAYTAPKPISNLVLETTENSLNATWTPPEGTSTTFNADLELDGKLENKTLNLSKPTTTFSNLKTGANYTVRVYSFSGHLQSQAVQESKFTKPSRPTDPRVFSSDNDSITFHWTAPENTGAVNYSVNLNSSFWNQRQTYSGVSRTEFTFKSLSSGSRYDFEVKTEVAGESSSPTSPLSHCTDVEKREIRLSMLCSSTGPLLCDEQGTRDEVFEELKAHLTQTFGDHIFWELEKQEN